MLEKKLLYAANWCSWEELQYNGWVYGLPLKNIDFRARHVLPSVLLQTTRKTSKSKDHIKALQQRLDSWKSRDIEELIFEAAIMQSYLNYITKAKEFFFFYSLFKVDIQNYVIVISLVTIY